MVSTQGIPEHVAEIEDAVSAMLEEVAEVPEPALHQRAFRNLVDGGFVRSPVEGGAEGIELREFAAVLRVCGRVGLDAPVLEDYFAQWVAATTSSLRIGSPHTVALGGSDGRRLVKWADEHRPVVVIRHLGAAAELVVVAAISSGDVTLAGEPLGCIRLGTTLDWGASDLTFEQIETQFALLRSAMIIGAAERAMQLSEKYSVDREQFGKPIGQFQAIEQKLATLASHLTIASVSLDVALEWSPDGASSAVSHLDAMAAIIEARVLAGLVARSAHQIHGALGFTKEHRLHHTTRRLWSWRDEGPTEAEWAIRLARSALRRGDALWETIA